MALKHHHCGLGDHGDTNGLSEDSGDPDETERTPLLAGPSCKQSYRISGPASARRDNVFTPDESLSLSDSSNLPPHSERAHRQRSPSLGSYHDNQSNSRPTSITVINGSEMSADSPQPLLTFPNTRRFEILLPEGVSLRLENSGSVARDHLASERTFLAYMRTSLAIASSGVALVQFFSAASVSAPKGSIHRLHHYIRPLGASTVVVGLLVLFIGVARYFAVQAALTKGYFPVARLATGFIAVVLTALVTLTFAILIAGKLEAKQA